MPRIGYILYHILYPLSVVGKYEVAQLQRTTAASSCAMAPLDQSATTPHLRSSLPRVSDSEPSMSLVSREAAPFHQQRADMRGFRPGGLAISSASPAPPGHPQPGRHPRPLSGTVA